MLVNDIHLCLERDLGRPFPCGDSFGPWNFDSLVMSALFRMFGRPYIRWMCTKEVSDGREDDG